LQALYAGQVGYIVANMRTVQEAAVGETLFDVGNTAVVPFPGFAPVKPNVFSGLFPVDTADYEDLKQALDRLCLNDPAVEVKPDSSPALGLGWRVGFLGLLHMEVNFLIISSLSSPRKHTMKIRRGCDARLLVSEVPLLTSAIVPETKKILKRQNNAIRM
jgi:GTP-binding protein LepA